MQLVHGHSLFRPGVITISPAAMDALSTHDRKAVDLLTLHLAGEWPDLDDVSRQANYAAARKGTTVVGEFNLRGTGNERLVAITDPDRVTMLVTAREAAVIRPWSRSFARAS
jgi:hypothetical protein